MLWDNIFEFFVMYVFGGRLVKNGQFLIYRGTIGAQWISTTNLESIDTSNNINLNILGMNLPLGNYLSLIATIITITFIVVLCCMFVYKIIKLIGGLIR